MRCRMDDEDEWCTLSGQFRRRGCSCVVSPIPPETGIGCQCPRCGSTCRKCPGFGFAQPQPRRPHRIVSAVRSQIKRLVRLRGSPPGFVRLAPVEVEALLRKLGDEDVDHWIHQVVDAGPPLRVFDVLIVRDRRRADG